MDKVESTWLFFYLPLSPKYLPLPSPLYPPLPPKYLLLPPPYHHCRRNSINLQSRGQRYGGSIDRLRVRIPARNGWRIFFSRVNFVCWLLFVVCSTPVLLQWSVKDPGHSSKSAGGRLHLNIHTPWPSEVGVGWLCRCPGIVWEPIWKRPHMHLVRQHFGHNRLMKVVNQSFFFIL